MASIDAGEAVTIGDGDAAVELEGLKKFALGTFAMPSMEGEGIEAKARTRSRLPPASCPPSRRTSTTTKWSSTS